MLGFPNGCFSIPRDTKVSLSHLEMSQRTFSFNIGLGLYCIQSRDSNVGLGVMKCKSWEDFGEAKQTVPPKVEISTGINLFPYVAKMNLVILLQRNKAAPSTFTWISASKKDVHNYYIFIDSFSEL